MFAVQRGVDGLNKTFSSYLFHEKKGGGGPIDASHTQFLAGSLRIVQQDERRVGGNNVPIFFSPSRTPVTAESFDNSPVVNLPDLRTPSTLC